MPHSRHLKAKTDEEIGTLLSHGSSLESSPETRRTKPRMTVIFAVIHTITRRLGRKKKLISYSTDSDVKDAFLASSSPILCDEAISVRIDVLNSTTCDQRRPKSSTSPSQLTRPFSTIGCPIRDLAFEPAVQHGLDTDVHHQQGHAIMIPTIVVTPAEPCSRIPSPELPRSREQDRSGVSMYLLPPASPINISMDGPKGFSRSHTLRTSSSLSSPDCRSRKVSTFQHTRFTPGGKRWSSLNQQSDKETRSLATWLLTYTVIFLVCVYVAVDNIPSNIRIRASKRKIRR